MEPLTADRKALQINLDQRFFGTFAEIGAGQEVARHFFRVGGAAGTIAKTISAYDMTFSDSIYGRVGRYVSKERLGNMLDHEYLLLLERLSSKRGSDTAFFVFANTVAARSFQGANESHGWLGVRFQSSPLSQPNNIIIHVRMKDRDNLLQQQALGIIGVNLLYGALYLRDNPDKFVESLLDELSIDRIEVDMIEFSGPEMSHVDNRLMSLKLLQHELTEAIMFSPDGRVLQPSEVLYKRPILVQRGSFRPVTHVNVDMLNGALDQFLAIPSVKEKDPVILFEITLKNLLASGSFDDTDFIARADTLSSLGHTVLISDYSEYHRLTRYFRRYTHEMLGMAMGINSLLQIFNEKFYSNLEGGILEALGRLFAASVKLYVYPMSRDAYTRYLATIDDRELIAEHHELPDLVTAQDVRVLPHLKYLYMHLLSSGNIEAIQKFSPEHFTIFSRDILQKIRDGDSEWEKSVPTSAAKIIKERNMFK